MKGTLELTPRQCSWEPEREPKDPRAPFVIALSEGPESLAVLRFSARALSELEAAIAAARKAHAERRALRKGQG
jgi:hypothetical protein